MSLPLPVRLLAAALSLLSALPGPASAERTYDEFQTWFQVTATGPVGPGRRFSAYIEAQPRFGDDSRRLYRTIVRPAVVYNVSPDLSLWLGYAWTPGYLDADYRSDFRNESRTWQQILLNSRPEGRWVPDFLSGLVVQNRLRQEQRFIQDAGGTANRTRYLLRGSVPFASGGTAGLTVYDELFFNLDTAPRGPRRGFDRNRFFAGPYVQTSHGRYEIGYLAEHGNNFRDGDRLIQGVLTSINFTF